MKASLPEIPCSALCDLAYIGILGCFEDSSIAQSSSAATHDVWLHMA